MIISENSTYYWKGKGHFYRYNNNFKISSERLKNTQMINKGTHQVSKNPVS